MYASVVACPGGGAGERKGGAPAQQGAREGPGGRARAHQGGAWAQQGAREGGGRGAYVYKKKKRYSRRRGFSRLFAPTTWVRSVWGPCVPCVYRADIITDICSDTYSDICTDIYLYAPIYVPIFTACARYQAYQQGWWSKYAAPAFGSRIRA